MGLELPPGVNHPASLQSQRRQHENAARARARANRQANNGLDGCLVGLGANAFLLALAIPQYLEIASRIESEPLAIGLSIGASIIEFYVVNSIIAYAIREAL